MASLEMVENKFVWYHPPISRVTNVSKVDARYMQMAGAGNYTALQLIVIQLSVR